jgi:DNA-directed RNA polymerase specialized sigma24 family protein
MSDTSLRGSSPAPDPSEHNDSMIAIFMAILAAMPAAQRNALLLLLDFLNQLPREELAILAIAVQPHLTNAEIAALTGVCERQVYRWERFQAFRPTAADYWRDHQESFYLPDEPAA